MSGQLCMTNWENAVGVHRRRELVFYSVKQARNNVLCGFDAEWFGKKCAGARHLQLSRPVVDNIAAHQDDFQFRLQIAQFLRNFCAVYLSQKIIHECQVKNLGLGQL